jgi:arylsulfatase
LALIPQNAKLTPRPDNLLKRWHQLTPEEQKLFNRQAEVFAAYWAYIDHEIGHVIQHIEDMGKLDNTLIIYVAGDNGNSAEGSLAGTPNEVASLQGIDVPVADQLKLNDAWGSDQTFPHMALARTWAFDTPFSWTKQIALHWGGMLQGIAVS